MAAGGRQSTGLGTGGMATKLHAADLARQDGHPGITSRVGSDPDVIMRICQRGTPGHLLPAHAEQTGRPQALPAGRRRRRRADCWWIPGRRGRWRTAAACCRWGSPRWMGSLTAATRCEIMNPSGKVLALGMCNYSSRDLRNLCGKQSTEIERIVGFTFGDEVIHRNNMVLMRYDG